MGEERVLGPADAWTSDGTYALMLEAPTSKWCVRVVRGEWTWTGSGWAIGHAPASGWLRGKDAVDRAAKFAAAYVREHPGHQRLAPDKRTPEPPGRAGSGGG